MSPQLSSGVGRLQHPQSVCNHRFGFGEISSSQRVRVISFRPRRGVGRSTLVDALAVVASGRWPAARIRAVERGSFSSSFTIVRVAFRRWPESPESS